MGTSHLSPATLALPSCAGSPRSASSCEPTGEPTGVAAAQNQPLIISKQVGGPEDLVRAARLLSGLGDLREGVCEGAEWPAWLASPALSSTPSDDPQLSSSFSTVPEVDLEASPPKPCAGGAPLQSVLPIPTRPWAGAELWQVGARLAELRDDTVLAAKAAVASLPAARPRPRSDALCFRSPSAPNADEMRARLKELRADIVLAAQAADANLPAACRPRSAALVSPPSPPIADAWRERLDLVAKRPSSCPPATSAPLLPGVPPPFGGFPGGFPMLSRSARLKPLIVTLDMISDALKRNAATAPPLLPPCKRARPSD